MIGKVKKWLGIEGVKLELITAGEFNPRSGYVSGSVRLMSKNAQTVTAIKIALIEKYARGRNEEQLIDEYELGQMIIKEKIEVPEGGVPVEVPFTLNFELVPSPVDEFGGKNVFFSGIAWAARKIRNARSEYRLEAEANVKGVGLNPFDRKVLNG